MKIGIFDSGRGGEFVARELRHMLPGHEYIVVNDRAHVPYGSRSDTEVVSLTDAAIQPLLAAGCTIVVIACNTATMAAIATLRARYTSTQFIGIEPMIKPASELSKTQRITVLATPLTLQSPRYQHLKTTYGSRLIIDEPSTLGWAAHIEQSKQALISFDAVAQSVASGSDTIILACTHYHILISKLRKQFPGVTVLQPTSAIARQLVRLMAQTQQ